MRLAEGPIPATSISPAPRSRASSLHQRLSSVSDPLGRPSPPVGVASERTSPAEARHMRRPWTGASSFHPGTVRRAHRLGPLKDDPVTLRHKRLHHFMDGRLPPSARRFYRVLVRVPLAGLSTQNPGHGGPYLLQQQPFP